MNAIFTIMPANYSYVLGGLQQHKGKVPAARCNGSSATQAGVISSVLASVMKPKDNELVV